MKKEQVTNIRTKDAHELTHAVHDLKGQYAQLMFDLRSGKTTAIKDLRRIRKEIAVIHTIIKEKLTHTS